MGTRGAFGVIIGEQEKIAYNHFDSYPDGKGVEVLGWLRTVIEDGRLDEIKEQSKSVRVIDEDEKPTPEDVEKLKPYTNLNVSEQSTDDWYCLTREMQGDLGMTLESGYMLDGSSFPLDSLFCEWGYIVDLDAGVLEVYKGFQKERPQQGRWAGRPTDEENEKDYAAHLEHAKNQGREPWRGPVPDYKAIELVASFPFDALPSDDDFIAQLRESDEEDDE